MARAAGTRSLRNKSPAPKSAISSKEIEQFEELAAELSATLVRTPALEIDREIDSWLQKIVLALNLDRSGVAQIDPKKKTLVVTHQWAREGLPAAPLAEELIRRAPWYAKTLMSGKMVVFSSIKELPAELEKADLKTFREHIPKSNVSIPLKVGGEIVGAVGFATLRKERPWPSSLIRRLQVIAEIFGNALERKRAAIEIAVLRRELAHVSRTAVMGELSASLAHQLNQPIAAIRNNAAAIQSMLRAKRPDLEEIRAAVSDIVQDNLRATETIKTLRAFFRNEQLNKTRIDPSEVIKDVVRLLGGDALIRNVALSVEVEPALPQVEGDRVQLQQAFINLVFNAFDAVAEAEHPREVKISAAKENEGRIKIEIRDSGDGIEDAVIARIFDPFFTTKKNGMGIGLSIARSIIKAHGGDLSARTNSDRGATFEVALPAIANSSMHNPQRYVS